MQLVRRQAAAVLLLACLAASSAEARVFFRWRKSSVDGDAIRQAGGRTAYEAAIHLNGSTGQLSVYSFEDGAHRVGRQLSRLFGVDELRIGRGSMSIATVHRDGRVHRLVLAPLGEDGPTLLFHVDQSESEYRGSQTPSHFSPVQGLEPYPGSVPLFSGRDENTSTGLAVSETTAAPLGVHRFYQSRLTANGWFPALPDAPRGADSGRPLFGFYLKGNALCCVYVGTDHASGASRITVLHRKMGVK